LSAAGATVEMMPIPTDLMKEEKGCSLLVYDFGNDPEKEKEPFRKALEKLEADGVAVAIISEPDLELMIELLALPRCENVVVKESADSATLAGAAARHLWGDVFGLEKHIPWGVRVYSMLVGDYQEKSVAIATISDFAASLGVRRKYLENIEKVVDELLMNALYDAPVDDTSQISAKAPARRGSDDALSDKLEQKAVVQYACDGQRFVVSVRDNYGTLKKETVLQYLDKCLHADQQIDRKEGGAGLGLYIVTNSVSRYMINVNPGTATEAVCVLDLTTPKLALHSFGVYKEKMEAAARLDPTGPTIVEPVAPAARRPAPMPKGLKAVVVAAVALLLVAVGVLLWKQLDEPPTGTLLIETRPPGANVRVDGTLRGVTDSESKTIISGLDATRPHVVRAEKEGYEPAQAVVRVSEEGRTTQRFRLEPLAVRLFVDSRPKGARILADGTDTGKITPAVIEVKPRSTHEIALKLEDYEVATRTIKSGDPGERQRMEVVNLRVSADWGSLRILSNPPGARVFIDGTMQRGRTPIESLAVRADKRITLELRHEDYATYREALTVEPRQEAVIRATLEKAGTLTLMTKPSCRAVIDDEITLRTPFESHPLAVGRHRVELRSSWPFISHSFQVRIHHRQNLEKRIEFGIVTAPRGYRIQRDGRTTRRMGLLPGSHTLILVDTESKKRFRVRIKVEAGQTHEIASPEKPPSPR
jgi:hypothetical protein